MSFAMPCSIAHTFGMVRSSHKKITQTASAEDDAFAHLKKAHPELYTTALPHRGSILSRVEPKRTRDALFASLASSIVSQQLSRKAAETIYGRVAALLGGTITARGISDANDIKLRACGLSEAKIKSLKDLAEHVLSGKLDLLALKKLPPAEAVEALVEVRGIGPWTAEMFLIFALGAPDIFSPGDLILARMTEEVHGLPKGTKPKELAKLAEKWSPHRSFVSLLMWRLHHAKEDEKRKVK